jgi:peptide/nickel transport system ATP-binding protein
MITPALSVRNLTVSFPDDEGAPVVDGISFDLAPGELAALVGESGCGKSVTSRAIMGLLPAHRARTESHSIRLGGTEISRLNARGWRTIRGKEIAMVFQEPSTALDPVFTIGSQLCQVIRRHCASGRDETRRRALLALEQGGFRNPSDVYSAYPHQLSGGMRQLAMIALAISTGPRVLIADEPTTALDVSTQSLVIEQLKKLRDAGTGILLVTHDLGVVAQSCCRAMVMYSGRLVETGPYPEMYRQPLHPYTQGLLAAVPRIAAGKTRYARPIPGRVPAPRERGSGCHFADRCERGDAGCRTQFPALKDHGRSRVACHHPLESA